MSLLDINPEVISVVKTDPTVSKDETLFVRRLWEMGDPKERKRNV